MIYAQLPLIAFLLARLLPPGHRGLVLLLTLAALIPFDGVSTLMATRGLWGDPSITTLQLLALGLMGRSPTAFASGWRTPLLLALIGAIFYPLALGFGDFDPYRLGYQPWLLIAVLALPALFFWWRGQHLWLWLLTIDLLAWAAGLPESPNLWDTLLDPLLVLACLFLAARNGWRTYKHPS